MNDHISILLNNNYIAFQSFTRNDKSELYESMLNDEFMPMLHDTISLTEDANGNYDYASLSNLGMIYAFVHQRGKNRKEQSKREYIRELIHFLSVLQERGIDELRQCTRRDIERYQESIERRYEKSTTQARKITIVRSFIRWCYQERYIMKELARGLVSVKVEKEQIPERTVSEESLIHAIDYYKNNPKVQSLILLLATTGLRLAEIQSPSWSDLYYDVQRQKYYLRTLTKRNKIRHAHIKEYVLNVLREYRRRVGLSDAIIKEATSPFYPNRFGKPYTLTNLSTFLSDKLEEAGVRTLQQERITPHFLRHYFAQTAYANGAQLERISDTLGHSDMRITKENYLRGDLNKEHDVSEFVDLDIGRMNR